MKIKKIYTIAIMSIFLMESSFGENEFNMNQVNERINNMIELKLHFNVSMLNIQNRQSHAEFIGLTNLCKENWQSILENMDELEGDKDGKRLVMEAMQFLPAETYITAFEWMLNKLIANKFEKENIILFTNSYGPMRHFFKDNYQHPRVIASLNQLKTKVADDENASDYIDSVLSGESKEMLDNYREAHEGMPEGDIPVILLPNE